MKLFLFVLALVLLTKAAPAQAGSAPSDKPSPQEVLRMLEEGNKRFAAGESTHPHAGETRLHLAEHESQNDHAIATVLGCSDSRVPVELIFDAGVMDIFVVRVAGNVVNTDEAGSIEYGLAHVHTPVLVVLGHTQCGAVTAVVQAIQGQGAPLERNIPPLVAQIAPAVERVLETSPGLDGEQLVAAATQENVWMGVKRLFMTSPAVRELVASGRTMVVGAIYDVGSGLVEWLPQQRVQEILQEVEQNPERAMEPMADE